jgi:hypothetical protein
VNSSRSQPANPCLQGRRYETVLQCSNRAQTHFFCHANMTAQLLASELANLIQESKRKQNDLRQVGTAHCDGLSSNSHSGHHTSFILLVRFRYSTAD